MFKTVLFVILITFLFFLSFLGLGVVISDNELKSDSEKLILKAKQQKEIKFINASELPQPVYNYLNLVEKDSLLFNRFVKLNIKGEFKPSIDGEWKSLEVVQYFLTTEPAFIWDAELEMSSLAWIKSTETYLDNRGSVISRLWSSVKIESSLGEEIDKSSLVRYLIESVYYPTVWKDTSLIKWKEIDSLNVKAFIKFGVNHASAVFHFDNEGYIKSVSSNDKYLNARGILESIPFTQFYSEYREYDNLIIPSKITMEWDFDGNKFTFGKFSITSFDINKF